MFVYRFADNPYKPSAWNTCANGGNNLDTCGLEGVFCFDPSRPAVRYFGDYEVTEDVTADFLMNQFGTSFFGGELNILDVDDNEIVSRGYGRYADFQSENLYDCIYIPEVFVCFSEY